MMLETLRASSVDQTMPPAPRSPEVLEQPRFLLLSDPLSDIIFLCKSLLVCCKCAERCSLDT
jgi:hypothetical protein